MKFSKKTFNTQTENEYRTKTGALVFTEYHSDHSLQVTVDGYFFTAPALRETAILFLKMADALDERNAKDKSDD